MDINHNDNSFGHDGDGQWPFQTFVKQLIIDMFDPVWEVWHGSMMALREILAHQGASAGVLKPYSHMDETLFIELEDKSIPSTLKREENLPLYSQMCHNDQSINSVVQ